MNKFLALVVLLSSTFQTAVAEERSILTDCESGDQKACSGILEGCRSDNAAACFLVGKISLDQKNFDLAEGAFQKSCTLGLARGCSILEKLQMNRQYERELQMKMAMKAPRQPAPNIGCPLAALADAQTGSNMAASMCR